MQIRINKNLIKLIFGIIAVFAVWWIVRCQCIGLGPLTPAGIRDYIQSFGRGAAIVYVVAYALNTVSILPPIAILSLSAGIAFGKVWGAVFLMSGAMLGTSATFFISRIFGRAFIERLTKGRLKNLDDLLGRRGFLTILFFRVVPLLPYEVLNYASGLSKIKFRDYSLATFLGLIPGVVVSAFFGGTLGEIKSIGDIFSLKFGIAALALLIVIAIPLLYKYIKRRKGV